MKIAIIDADLIGRKNHRFPNLACMKMSGYYKSQGYDVVLKTDYEKLDEFDLVKISKVFTDTPFPKGVLDFSNVEHGGTGFFFDKAPNLPNEIEHHFPDYHLYDEWVNEQVSKGFNVSQFDDYLNASIGFMTRGCFRKCDFCVNKKYDKCLTHSPLDEFYDKTRKHISLWDDNFLANPKWRDLLTDLENTKKTISIQTRLRYSIND